MRINLFSVDDAESVKTIRTDLVVSQEDAAIAFDSNNPLAVQVTAAGDDSEPFMLTVGISESQPDRPADERAMPGNIALADVTMTLAPVGTGSQADPSGCTSSMNGDSGYDAVLTVTCTFDNVPVNTYTAEVTVGGDYYAGVAEDVLTVFDPSLGFTTGGGWFHWPGTTDKTNFGYTMKYGKNGNNVKGSLLLIRHLADGTKYRIKSNAVSGLALGEDPEVPVGWASFSGKNTYLEPGMPEPEGNHQFTAYVEDRDEPGSGNDRFWITARDKNGVTIPAMSMTEPAPANAVPIQGGNIVAPH